MALACLPALEELGVGYAAHTEEAAAYLAEYCSLPSTRFSYLNNRERAVFPLFTTYLP